MASTVEVDVPDYANAILLATDATEIKVLLGVEAKGKQNAPVDSGFYRNEIRADLGNKETVANAEYSAPIEYGVGGTARTPNPVMRNAARDEQRTAADTYLREFEKHV